MCLAVPRKIVRIVGEYAELSDGRKVKIPNFSKSRPGDFVLVQGDMVIQKVDKSQVENLMEIAESLKLIGRRGKNG